MSSKATRQIDKTAWSGYMVSAQKGDKKAYQTLLTEISPIIRSFLNRRIFNKEHIEDILQEVLLAIHKSRHTYRPDQPFEHWMYGIARFKMIDFLRKHTRLNKNEINVNEYETFLAVDTNNTVESKESVDDIQKALNTLPEKQKKIVTLTKLEGYSIADVAEKLDMSESAVKVAAHRAYKKIKTWLVYYGYE